MGCLEVGKKCKGVKPAGPGKIVFHSLAPKRYPLKIYMLSLYVFICNNKASTSEYSPKEIIQIGYVTMIKKNEENAKFFKNGNCRQVTQQERSSHF